MKVLQINSVCQEGGSTGRIVWDIAEGLRNEGLDAPIAYGYQYEHHDIPDSFCMNSIPALKASILKTRLWPRHGFYNVKATKRLLAWMEEMQPDVVHLHNLHGHYINVSLLFSYLAKTEVPVIWTLHDCWAFTGWCAYYDLAGCSRWTRGCGKCPCRKDYPFTWFFDLSASNREMKKDVFTQLENMTIVVPSEWLGREVKRSFLADMPIKVINNGIDLNVFSPRDSDFRKKLGLEEKIIVLAVANGMSERKGSSYLFELSRGLDQEHVLVVIGAESRFRASLGKRAICLPRTSSATELAGAYSAADVLVNPTLEDNFPTVNLEALACGTPVVTFQTGGSPESVGPCGLVVPRSDSGELIRAINGIGRKDLPASSACRQRAVEKYDKHIMIGRYCSLYESIASRSIA